MAVRIPSSHQSSHLDVDAEFAADNEPVSFACAQCARQFSARRFDVEAKRASGARCQYCGGGLLLPSRESGRASVTKCVVCGRPCAGRGSSARVAAARAAPPSPSTTPATPPGHHPRAPGAPSTSATSSKRCRRTR